jgi:hypothetical protein
MFGASSVPGVMKLLDQYTADTEIGRARVQRAVLMLSEGKIDKLRHFVEQARKDFRDVLYWTGLPSKAG